MSEPHPETRGRILRVMDYMEAHVTRNLTLDELAAQACLSPFHFHRVFTASVGEGPLEYFRRLRLETAALSLAYHKGRRITDIAFEFGYNSPEVFVRAFRKHLGVPPGLYRRDPVAALREGGLRRVPELPAPFRPEPFQLSVGAIPPAEVLAVRSWNGYGMHLSELWADLCRKGESVSLGPGTVDYWGLGLDDPILTPGDRCRYIACLVPKPGHSLPKTLPPETFRYRLPGGTSVQMSVSGGPEAFFNAYRWLYCVWFNDKPWEPVDAPPLEQYRDKEGGTTMLHVLVRKRAL